MLRGAKKCTFSKKNTFLGTLCAKKLYLCVDKSVILWTAMGINAKIAAISYLNTIPFLYGIRHEGSLCAELLLAPPSENVRHFIEGKVDLALIPAAVVPTLKDAQVITDYCIGAVGPVRTAYQFQEFLR